MNAIVTAALIVFVALLTGFLVIYEICERYSIEKSTKDTHEAEHSHEIMCDL
jgi:hypothetical protein